MPKHSVGVDISDHTIEVVELFGSGDNIKIVGLGRAKIPAGAVESGRIKDAEKLSQALHEAMDNAQPEKISAKEIIFAVPESQVYTHIFTLGPHEKKVREDLIREEVAKNIPVKADDLIFESKILSETKDGTEILLAVSSREVMLEWQTFFANQKIKVEVFDIETLATFRDLFVTMPDKPVGVVDIGTKSTHVGIFDARGLVFSYTSALAGTAFTTELKKTLGIKNATAVEKKKGDGLKAKNKKEVAALASVADKIIRDLQEAMVYYKEKTGQPVAQVILVGGTAQMSGLVDYFKAQGLPAEIGRSVLVGEAPLEYIEAVGLALRGLDKKWNKRDLSLPNPKEEQLVKKIKNKKETKTENFVIDEDNNKLKKQIILLVLVGILGVALVVGAFVYRNQQRAQKEAQKEALLEQSPVLATEPSEELSVGTETRLMDTPTSTEELETATTTTVDETSPESFVLITQTGLGYLNVRSGAGQQFPVVATVDVGEVLAVIEETTDWVRVKLPDDSEGWVSAEYTRVVDENGEEI